MKLFGACFKKYARCCIRTISRKMFFLRGDYVRLMNLFSQIVSKIGSTICWTTRRWCERSETKVGRRLLSFPTSRFLKRNYFCEVSIRQTTGLKPLYTTIATVTMNLIVSAAIVLLNPYVTVYISYKIPPFALSVHIPDVSTSIYVEVDSKVLLGLPFCDKASGRLHHSGTPLGLHRVPYR